VTDCCDESEWLKERIAAKKATIAAIDTAITAVLTSGQSYQLNTGQTQQLVTKASVGSLRLLVQGLEQDVLALQQRLNGCGSFNVRPGW
jgi:hypothetical protein